MFINKYGELRSGWAIAILMIMYIVVAVVTVFLPINNYMYIDIISNIIFVGLTLLLFRVLYGRPLGQIGLDPTKAAAELVYGCVFGIVAISIVMLCLVLSGQAKVVSIQTDTLTDYLFYVSLLLYVSVGFCEEIMVRGFMMTALKTTRNKYIIIGGTGLIFSLLHLGNPGFTLISLVNIFLVGLLFAYMLVKTGKLWVPIGFHITWNFFQGNVFGMSVSGTGGGMSLIEADLVGANWITGGSFGPEAGIIVTVVIILSLLYIHFLLKPSDSLSWRIDNHLPLIKARKAEVNNE